MKVRFAKVVVMAEQREIQQQISTEEVDGPQGQRTIEDFLKPVIRDDYSAVKQAAIEETTLSLSLH